MGTFSPFRLKIANSVLFFKGIIGEYIPSIVATFTPMKESNEFGHTVFSSENLNDDSPDVIVNIIKKKDEKTMDKYENEVVWRMFPVIKSKIFVAGIPVGPKSDSWDFIGLIQYKNRASIYKMTSSMEYKQSFHLNKRVWK